MGLFDRVVPSEALRWGYLDGYLPPAPEGMVWGGWASRNYGAVRCGPPLEWPHLELAPAVYRFGTPWSDVDADPLADIISLTASIDGRTPGWGEEADPCYLGGSRCPTCVVCPHAPTNPGSSHG